MTKRRQCPNCKGKGELVTVCNHCQTPHSCTCPDCKGKGLLPFEELILCEKCGSKFRCPLTEKKRCKNTTYDYQIKKSPYKLIIQNGIAIRQCFCKDCSSTGEWKFCDTKMIEHPKKQKPSKPEPMSRKEEEFLADRKGMRLSKQERWERDYGGRDGSGMDF